MHIKQKQNDTQLSFPREYLTPITEDQEDAFNSKRPPFDRVVLSEDRLT
jgi:hypothetical protein